jgi:hypothetical protein
MRLLLTLIFFVASIVSALLGHVDYAMAGVFLGPGMHLHADQLGQGQLDYEEHPVHHATGNARSAFMRNLPAQGEYAISPERFFLLTERNEMPLNAILPAAFGTSYQARINNVGIIAGLILDVNVTVNTTVGGGSLTATAQWPWNIIKRIIVTANGQNELFAIEGMDLRARWLRVFRNAVDNASSYSGTISTGNNNVILELFIPFAHDETTLIGSLYAQSDETYLNLELTTAAAADIITAAGGATINSISGTITPHLVFYEIPMVSDGQRNVIVLPDLSELHSMTYIDNPFANTGDVATRLLRSAGQLLAVYQRADSGTAGLSPWTDLDEIRWEYAGNQRPRRYNPVRPLRAKMNGDYNGDINPRAQHYAVLDFEVDNPMRDVVYPKGVIDLQTVFAVKTGTSLSNAKMHVVAETLYGGA